MAKYTLLEIIQKVLRAMESDLVDSYDETVESLSVAHICQRVYDEMVVNSRIPEHMELVQATALGDSSKPTYMQIPVSVKDIESVQYDHADPAVSGEIDYVEMTYCDPKTFLKRSHALDATDTTNYQTITDDSGVKIIVNRTQYPTYFTSLDDHTLIFDSYKEADESSLQATKSLIYARTVPSLTLDNDETPDMDEGLFPQFINEVISTAFVELKQTPNPKAEQKARQQKVRRQNDRTRIRTNPRFPDFGRK